MKKPLQTTMEEAVAFEIEMGLRPDYSALEKKLIAENGQFKQEIKHLTARLATEQLKQVEEVKNFCAGLHRELERLIDESKLPVAKKEHLTQKITALSKSKLDAGVIEIFNYLEIK